MTSAARAAVALALVLAAALDDWLSSELFLRRDTLAHLVGALVVNAVMLVGLLALARALLPQRALTVLLRSLALVGLAAVLISAWRGAFSGGASASAALRLGAASVLLVSGVTLMLRLDDEAANRLMLAVSLASVAFMLVPAAWRLTTPAPRVWIGPVLAASPAVPVAGRSGTIFLLLDELGYEAAAPLVADLRNAGMNIRSGALAPVGENTLNVVPQMFSGHPFPNASPCGISTVCSGANTLDFSRIVVQRNDVDVTGLLLPYCDIQGLRSCFALPLSHEFGSVYRSLAMFYLRRLGLSHLDLPGKPVEPPDQQRRLLQMQLDFIESSRFWTEGGVLYAHLPIPHPPGLNGQTTLDADYASNVEAARQILARLVARARMQFGDRFSILITSDHPLRQYWCTGGVYKAADCQTRAAFQTTRVPLIVASPGSLPSQTLTSNDQVFQVLNDLAGSVLP